MIVAISGHLLYYMYFGDRLRERHLLATFMDMELHF